jgi:hypothetical protein
VWSLGNLQPTATFLASMFNSSREIHVVGTVLKIRKHGKHLCFVTVRLEGNEKSKIDGLGQIQAIVCRQEMGSDGTYKESMRYLKPCTEHTFRGNYRKAKSGTMSLFITESKAVRFTCGVSPSLVWKLLEDVNSNTVNIGVAASLVGLTTPEFQQVLSPGTSKQQRKAFCSKTARLVSTGKECRGRIRKPKLASQELARLERLKTDCRGLNEIVLDSAWLRMNAGTVALGDADPLANIVSGGKISVGQGGGRHHYAEKKKRPQVKTMIKLVQEVVQSGQTIIDVGGGRGDLGIALAKTFPGHQVLVYEPNRPSCDQGRARATDLGFSNIAFKCEPLEALARKLGNPQYGVERQDGRRPLLVSLHACGGLSDAILEVCGTFKLTFCLCTCCFASFPQLRPKEVCSREDYLFLSRIAETNELVDGAQYCATRIINSLRVKAYLGSNWSVRLYRFPKEWSGRNFVIQGRCRNEGKCAVEMARPLKKSKLLEPANATPKK